MRCISHLEMKCVPKNTEKHRRSFVRVGRLRGMLRQIGSAQMDFIDHEALEFSPRHRAQGLRTTAEDNGVLDFVNEKLPQVTNVGRFQCLSQQSVSAHVADTISGSRRVAGLQFCGLCDGR